MWSIDKELADLTSPCPDISKSRHHPKQSYLRQTGITQRKDLRVCGGVLEAAVQHRRNRLSTQVEGLACLAQPN